MRRWAEKEEAREGTGEGRGNGPRYDNASMLLFFCCHSRGGWGGGPFWRTALQHVIIILMSCTHCFSFLGLSRLLPPFPTIFRPERVNSLLNPSITLTRRNEQRVLITASADWTLYID
ncbi:hypothetical protein LZ31DRAFT_149711 [Colletotrichum somersetense]|nr:hypothetical protein LZ31DRAFT_149711 [Colletotrichum somersetense]